MKVLDLIISEGGQFRTVFFSGFWHIGKFGVARRMRHPVFAGRTSGVDVVNLMILSNTFSESYYLCSFTYQGHTYLNSRNGR